MWKALWRFTLRVESVMKVYFSIWVFHQNCTKFLKLAPNAGAHFFCFPKTVYLIGCFFLILPYKQSSARFYCVKGYRWKQKLCSWGEQSWVHIDIFTDSSICVPLHKHVMCCLLMFCHIWRIEAHLPEQIWALQYPLIFLSSPQYLCFDQKNE